MAVVAGADMVAAEGVAFMAAAVDSAAVALEEAVSGDIPAAVVTVVTPVAMRADTAADTRVAIAERAE